MIETHHVGVGTDGFRGAAVSYIFSIKRKLSSFSRSSQFLAVSILDKYIESYMKNGQQGEPLNGQLYALACLYLAYKFNGQKQSIFQNFMNELALTQWQEIDRDKILQIEGEVLMMINFEIPLETVFTHLEYSLIDEKVEGDDCKVYILKTLKIMRVSLEMNSTLTKFPHLGYELFQLIKNKSGKKKIIKLYKEVQNFLKRQ